MADESKAEQLMKLAIGTVLRQRWRVIKKLGEGSFGAVYKVVDVTSNHEYAMKVEPTSEEDSSIAMEVAVLKTFRNSRTPHPHTCSYIDSGTTSNIRFIVMKLVGPNLSEVRKNCPHRRLSESTTVRIGVQCIRSIESLHRIGFIHRDIKPQNYAIGRGDSQRTIFLLDFGLARQYVNREGKLRPPRKVVGFRGTVRYASLNAHLRRDLGRQDDLWSLLYMLIELQRGKLPWRKYSEKDKVAVIKRNASADELLHGMAKDFHEILNELQGVQFKDTPNYEWLCERLKGTIDRERYSDEDPFDWESGGSAYETLRKAAVGQRPFKVQKADQRRQKEHGDEERSHVSE